MNYRNSNDLEYEIDVLSRYLKFNPMIDLRRYFRASLTPPLKSIVFNRFIPYCQEVNHKIFGIEGLEVSHLDSSFLDVYIVKKGVPSKSILFKYGHFYIMEPVSTTPIFILPTFKNPIVLDISAAPGGKTFLLANMFRDGVVISNEPDRVRRKRLMNNIDKYSLFNVLVTGYRGERYPDGQQFDIVLFDAPCSATNLLYKRYYHVLNNIRRTSEFQKLQIRILKRIYDILKGGGYLLYMTCTISKLECEEVIREAIEMGFTTLPIKDKIPFIAIPGDTFEDSYPELINTIYILPDLNMEIYGGNIGTMYIALMRKK